MPDNSMSEKTSEQDAVARLRADLTAMVARARHQEYWHLMLDGHAQDLAQAEATLRATAILRPLPDPRTAVLEAALRQIALRDTHHECGARSGVGANGWPTYALSITKGQFALIAEAALAAVPVTPDPR